MLGLLKEALHERTSEAPTIHVDPVLLQSPFGPQGVIFKEVFADDQALLASGDGEWLRAVLAIDWLPLRPVAAKYYQALWEFNIAAARKRRRSIRVETAAGAAYRLLFERPTAGNAGTPILHPAPIPPVPQPLVVNADQLAPGVVPIRIRGRTPKCFFAMAKAFTGVHLMGRSGSADEVEHLLRVSPPFARACGFSLPDRAKGYRHTDIPKLRKLEQFDEIMCSRGLWGEIRVQAIRENLARELIPIKGQDLVEDTTHYVAYSAMDQVALPAPANANGPAPADPAAGTKLRSRRGCSCPRRWPAS